MKTIKKSGNNIPIYTNYIFSWLIVFIIPIPLILVLLNVGLIKVLYTVFAIGALPLAGFSMYFTKIVIPAPDTDPSKAVNERLRLI